MWGIMIGGYRLDVFQFSRFFLSSTRGSSLHFTHHRRCQTKNTTIKKERDREEGISGAERSLNQSRLIFRLLRKQGQSIMALWICVFEVCVHTHITHLVLSSSPDLTGFLRSAIGNTIDVD